MSNSVEYRKPYEESRRRHRQSRRELILQTARDVFLRKGYAGAGMDEIAEAAGLSVGTVYLYFSNKPVLYLSLLDSAFENQEKALRRAALRGSTATDKVLKMAEAYADYFLREPEYFQALIFLQHGDLRIPESEALAERLADRGAALLRFVANLIEAGIERGEFRKVDAFNTALFLWGAWNGVIGLTLRKDPLRLERKHLKSLFKFGANLIQEGLAPR
jgi:AcrR family transcriptional regulator